MAPTPKDSGRIGEERCWAITFLLFQQCVGSARAVVSLRSDYSCIKRQGTKSGAMAGGEWGLTKKDKELRESELDTI